LKIYNTELLIFCALQVTVFHEVKYFYFGFESIAGTDTVVSCSIS